MKLYIVVRSDLPPGLQTAQSCHALSEFAQEHPELYKEWKRDNNLVVLASPGKDALAKLAYDMTNRGVAFSMFTEPDLGGELTAICIEPKGGRYLSTLPLALRQAA